MITSKIVHDTRREKKSNKVCCYQVQTISKDVFLLLLFLFVDGMKDICLMFVKLVSTVTQQFQLVESHKRVSLLCSHTTVREGLPSHGCSCFKSQMYCYTMDVPIASAGISGVSPCTFLSTTLLQPFCANLSPI